MFSLIVKMYRALGRPAVSKNIFEYAGTITADNSELIQKVQELPSHFGSFLYIKFNGDNVTLEFMLPATEHGRFHQSLGNLIQSTPSLDYGIPPEEFYISDIDYYSKDTIKPPELVSLNEYCEFVRLLTMLATGKSITNSQSGTHNLLFILVADGKSPSKTLSMGIHLTEDILKYPLQDLNLLQELLSKDMDGKVHIEERRSILRLAIAETLATVDDPKKLFESLVINWGDVLEKYRHNLLAFLHQFSFDKVRKEIAASEFDHATKLSAVLGDVTGKLLAVPISLAGLLLLRKATEWQEFGIYAVGIIVASALFIGILVNQWMQVIRIRNSFELVFGQYNNKLSTFPEELSTPIKKAKKLIERQKHILVVTFLGLFIISIVPIGGVVYFWHTILIPEKNASSTTSASSSGRSSGSSASSASSGRSSASSGRSSATRTTP